MEQGCLVKTASCCRCLCVYCAHQQVGRVTDWSLVDSSGVKATQHIKERSGEAVSFFKLRAQVNLETHCIPREDGNQWDPRVL